MAEGDSGALYETSMSQIGLETSNIYIAIV